MSDPKIEVRDMRQQDWVWTSKTILFDKRVDENMYKVYAGLAAFANNETQVAFPSIDTLRDKINMGRNSVIEALKKLEKISLIKIKKTSGKSNVYYLMDYTAPQIVSTPEKPKDETQNLKKIPKLATVSFFSGVRDLANHKYVSAEANRVRLFLGELSKKYDIKNKSGIWMEVQSFESYWTELNSSGTKQRWQMEKTFEVDKRLRVWLARKKEFARVDSLKETDKQIV